MVQSAHHTKDATGHYCVVKSGSTGAVIDKIGPFRWALLARLFVWLNDGVH